MIVLVRWMIKQKDDWSIEKITVRYAQDVGTFYDAKLTQEQLAKSSGREIYCTISTTRGLQILWIYACK